MLRKLRQKLAMIRYYSAPQRQTRWSRARDVAFFVAFLLCFPAAWIANLTVIRPATAFDLTGWIGESVGSNGGKSFDAAMSSNARSFAPTPNVKVIGNFRLVIEDDYHGWPFTTSVHRQRVRLGLDVFAAPKGQEDVKLASDSPQRQAIEKALAEDGHAEVVEHWRRDAIHVRQAWFNWFIAAGIWWILMVFSSSFVIGLAQFTWMHMQRGALKKQYLRRSEGRCHACGYDLTGLEFNERCPECGQLVM